MYDVGLSTQGARNEGTTGPKRQGAVEIPQRLEERGGVEHEAGPEVVARPAGVLEAWEEGENLH